MAIREEILEELLKDYKNPEDLIGKDGLLKELTKRLVEKAMDSELTHHWDTRSIHPRARTAAISAMANHRKDQGGFWRSFHRGSPGS